MLRLLRIEISRLFRSPLVLCVLLALTVFGVLMCTDRYGRLPDFIGGTGGPISVSGGPRRMRGEFAFFNVLSETVFPAIITIITAPILIGNDFIDRSINLPLYAPYSRTSIAVAKIVAYFVLSNVFCFVVPVVAMIQYCIPWFAQLTWERVGHVLITIGAVILCNIGVMSLPLLVGFLCHDVAKTMALSVVVFFVTCVLPNFLGDWFDVIYQFFPHPGYYGICDTYYNLPYFPDVVYPFGYMLVASICLCLVCSWGSIRAFQRAETK